MEIVPELERGRKGFVYRLSRLPVAHRLLAKARSLLSYWPETAGVLLLFVVLEIAVFSIEQAHWITPQPSLTIILALAVLITSLISRARLPAPVRHLMVLAIGAAVVLWQSTSLLIESESISKISQLAVALFSWWQTSSLGLTSQDTTHFAVFLALFTWVTGYASAWVYRQRHNAWTGVTLGALIILVNLSNLTNAHYIFFFFYVLAAMLLIGYTSQVKHYLKFQKHGVIYPTRIIVYVMVTTLCLGLVMTSLVWFAPAVPIKKADVLSGVPLRKSLDELLARFLSGVAVQQPYLSSSGQRTLSFVDPIDRSYTVHFLILAKRPFYWRTGVYNLYTSRGWTINQTTDNMSALSSPGADTEKLLNRTQVNHTVIPKVRTDMLPSAGEFQSADIPLALEALTPLTFNVSLVGQQRDFGLPEDILTIARNLRVTRSMAKTFTLSDIQQRLPPDLVLTSIGDTRETPSEANFESLARARRLTAIELSRKPGARDVVAHASSQLLNPDQRIRMTASVSTASASDLSQAGEKYPGQITDYYLQLPSGFPDRIRQLARSTTREVNTPYLKAIAIKNYLSQFPYNVLAENPPIGMDGVDYFLFTKQEGNCFYFASAMAVMLRSIGVPARLVAGYLPGEWDETNSLSVVRAKDYHSWVEVYFPRYGWAEFDPTPATIGTDPGIFDDDLLLEETGYNETLLDEGGSVTFEWPRFDVSLPTPGISIAFLVVILGLTIYIWQHYFAGLDFIGGMYARMCFLATLARIGPRPQQTPLEYCNRLVSAFPGRAEAISNIGQTYTARRFGRKQTPDTGQREKLKQSWRSIYPALLKRLLFLG